MEFTTATLLLIFGFFGMFLVTFFVMGLIVGWLANRHARETATPYMHPEMFDSNGNLIPDEILSVRFENEMPPTDDEEEII